MEVTTKEKTSRGGMGAAHTAEGPDDAYLRGMAFLR